jgi:hypothetical protein
VVLPAQLAGTVLLPPIQVHCCVEGLNSQRSLSSPKFPLASAPSPPKSQKLPLLSVQVAALSRPPGVLPGEGVPNVPYTPGTGYSLASAYPGPFVWGCRLRPRNACKCIHAHEQNAPQSTVLCHLDWIIP